MSLKEEILRLLREDIEFRYAVLGYLGLEEVVKSIKSLQEQVLLVQKSIERHAQILIGYSKRIEELSSRIEEHSKILAEHSKRLEELSNRVEEHSKVLIEHSKRIKELSSRIRDLSNRIEEHSKVLTEHTRILTEHSKRIEELSKRIEEHSKILIEHSKRIEELSNRIEEHSKILERHTTVLEEHTRAIRMLEGRVMGLTSALIGIRSALGITLEEFVREFLKGLLEARGIPKDKLKLERRIIRVDGKEFELNIFNEEPLILAEVTSIIEDVNEVNKVIERVKAIEKIYGRKPNYVFLVTPTIWSKVFREVVKRAKEHEIELIYGRVA